MASKGKEDDKRVDDAPETTTAQQSEKPKSRPPSSKPDLPPGAISGPFDSSAALLAQYGYTLGPSLGKGSYAVVKSAQSKKHKRKVAIKIISKKKAPEDYLTKFLPREIQVLKRLRHPHCITLLEAIETNTRIYLIMNLAENGDLLEYIRSNGALSDDGARTFFAQLVAATEYFHSMGIVHRDLKCENLLLDHNYNIVVSDFGFARASMIVPETNKRVLSQTFCGSYAYAPPEILRGIAYDAMLADIWSLGVVLFTMVSASLPFDDSHLKTLLEQVMRPVHFSRRKNISPEVKDLINKMLQPDVRKRYDLPEIKEHIWLKGEKLPNEEETKVVKPVLEGKVPDESVVATETKC
ncbi:testis-specific serine/threonine-protein kinase 3-like [Rhopilema esculentum]|uniref:testis-specific serine/threonine-protein kinase 3-like n=1 Tax=Rhopilema esculentum TaxID=499914 RepID=UPI0031CF4BD1|eukprot:gene16339-7729_t